MELTDHVTPQVLPLLRRYVDENMTGLEKAREVGLTGIRDAYTANA